MYRKLFPTLVAIISLLIISCEPLTMSVINIGASTGVSQSINGVVYKTFTIELDPLHAATLISDGVCAAIGIDRLPPIVTVAFAFFNAAADSVVRCFHASLRSAFVSVFLDQVQEILF